MPSIKTQDLYRVVITEAAGIAASGDVDFTVSVAPTRTNGFLVLSPENAVSREVVYFHNVIGNRIYVRGVNRRNPKLHPANDSVQMNDVEDIFNYYSDMVSPLFYMEKTGTLNVRIWGGTVLINRTQVTVADTNLTLTDNTTNYIVYDYLTNIVSVNTTGVGLVKVTVTVTSGVIGTPTYNVIKESYADPFVPDVSLVAPVIQNNQFAYADSTGSANAYAVTYTPAPTAYVAGQKFFFKANFQNTGAATINVNGLGAKSIKKLDGATDLASTDISSGAMVEIMYDGTNFQLTSIPQTIKNNDVTQLTSVNLLAAKTTLVAADKLLIGDSDASFVNKNITVGMLLAPIGGNGSDGALTISSGTTTIALDSNGYAEKNYSSITITGGTLTFSGAPTNGGVAVIKCSGKFVMSGGTISMAGLGAAGGIAGGTGAGNIGSAGHNVIKVVTSAAGGAGLRAGAGGAGGTGLSHFGGYLQGYCGGGGGGTGGSTSGAAGGAGGGVLFIEVKESFNFTVGTITAVGANGTSGSGISGGSGGGGGGAIFIKATNIIANTGTLNVNGGNGGNGLSPVSFDNYSGGGGGGSYSSGGAGGTGFAAGTAGTSNVFGSGGTGGTGSNAGGSNAGGGGGGGAGFYKVN